MINANSMLAVSARDFSAPLTHGEFNNECAWGLTNGEHVVTDCSVSICDESGRTYYFRSKSARKAFLKDIRGNLQKAQSTFFRE